MNATINHVGFILSLILENYFNNTNCFNILYDDELIDVMPSRTFLIYNTSTDLRYPFFTFGCQGMVLYTKRPKEMFELVEKVIRFTFSTKFHERRYIVMPAGDYEDDVFESDKLDYVADFVLAQNVDDGFEFYTNKFVGIEDQNDTVFLDKWYTTNGSFMLDENLYPDKIKDQQGKILRISTFDYKPYVNIDSEHGIELMMTKVYAEMHNMSTFIIIEEEFWGVIFENNYTATGAKGTLLTDKADISLGSWYSLPNYTKYFDLTETTVRIGVTFLVPAPTLAGGWFTPLFAFSTELWLGFIISFIGLSVSLFFYDVFYQKFIHTKKAINVKHLLVKSVELNFVTLFLQQSSSLFITVSYLRGIYLNIIIASLFFAAVYSGGFSSIMTIPRYAASIKDSLDLEASGIKWGAIHPALLDGFRDLAKYQNVVKNIMILTNDQIRDLMHKQGFAMLVDRVPNGLVLATRLAAKDAEFYRVLTDDLYSVNCILLVKRSSVLIPSIRDAFLSMKEAGLLYFWEMQAMFEENYPAQIAFRARDNSIPVVKLRWAHVQGAFGVLWLGLVGAFLVFLWELRNRKIKLKAK